MYIGVCQLFCKHWKSFQHNNNTFSCGGEDSCKEGILTCRSGDPCEIRCDGKAGCAAGAVINADTATDVTIICGKDDGCKDEIDIKCGTGACELHCNGGTSCESWGDIDVRRSTSFECIGDCPPEVPESSIDPIPRLLWTRYV